MGTKADRVEVADGQVVYANPEAGLYLSIYRVPVRS